MGIWNKLFSESEIEVALGKLNSVRSIDENGRVSFTLNSEVDYDLYRMVIVSAVSKSNESLAFWQNLTSQTLGSRAIEEGELNKRSFASEFNKILRKAKDSKKPFLIVFPVTNMSNFLEGRRKFGKANLTIYKTTLPRRARKIIKERLSLQREDGFNIHRDLEHHAAHSELVVARVQALNPFHAVEVASDAVYSFLGLCNLILDRTERRISFRVQDRLPVSKVVIAPYITTHDLSGTLASDAYWMEAWSALPGSHTLSEDRGIAFEGAALNGMACG